MVIKWVCQRTEVGGVGEGWGVPRKPRKEEPRKEDSSQGCGEGSIYKRLKGEGLGA